MINLLFVLILSAPGVRADVGANGDFVPAAETVTFEAVRARRSEQLDQSPRWAQVLAAKPVAHYLPVSALLDPAKLARGRERFLADVTKLWSHLEPDESSKVRRAVDARIESLAAKLSYKKLAKTWMVDGAPISLAETCLGDLLAREETRVRQPSWAEQLRESMEAYLAARDINPRAAFEAAQSRRAEQLREAPRRIRRLAARRVEAYVPLATLVDADKLARGRARLAADALELAKYFEPDPSSPARRVIDLRLVSVAHALSYPRLSQTWDESGAAVSLAETTLGDLFVREEARGRRPILFPRLRAWTGAHLQEIRKFVPVIAVVASSALSLWLVEHFGKTHFLTGFFLGALQVGVLGPLVSAATGWLVTPTTEYLKMWNARFTGEAEQSINQFFDGFKKHLEVGESLDEVRVAVLKKDGGDVAGMTGPQQLRNWPKLMRIFNGVPTTYNRLLRHRQHHGRALMTALWSDVVLTANFAKQFEKNLVDLNTNDETLLGPYRDRLIGRDAFAENDRLTGVYLELRDTLTRQHWGALAKWRVSAAHARGAALVRQLREEFRVPAYVTNQIIDNARHAADMITIAAATLAVNELRYFFFAEENRNMFPEAREVQRQIRASLQVQQLVERYQPEIQRIHRAAGFETGPCEGWLDETSGRRRKH